MNGTIEIDKAEEGTKLKSDVFKPKVAEPVAVPAEQDVKAQATKVLEQPSEKKDDSKVVWQFRHRRYRCISNVIDMNSPVSSINGKRSNRVIMARNYRYPLDLNDPEDLKLHESMLKSPQCGSDFYLLEKTSKDKSDLMDRGQTLKKLMDMPTDQLMGMLDSEELIDAGIIPGKDVNREELMIAIIDSKKLK